MPPLPEFSVIWIDPVPNLLAQQQPVQMIERELLHGTKPKANLFNTSEVARVGNYWVPQNSVTQEGTLWTVAKEGQYVRVPVMAYKTVSRSAAHIFATGLTVGLAAFMSLQAHTNERPVRIYLVLGNICSDLHPQEDAFRCYVGIAIQT